MHDYLRLILAVFACYRLSRMFALDDGPFFVFKRIRYWVKDRAWHEAGEPMPFDDDTLSDRYFGKWHNLAEGISCPFCIGTWVSLFLFPLLVWPTHGGDLFLLLVSISGAQVFLQTLDTK